MNKIRVATGKVKGDRVEIVLPEAFVPHFHLMRWPEEIYAGRVTLYDHKIRFSDLPQTSIGGNAS